VSKKNYLVYNPLRTASLTENRLPSGIQGTIINSELRRIFKQPASRSNNKVEYGESDVGEI